MRESISFIWVIVVLPELDSNDNSFISKNYFIFVFLFSITYHRTLLRSRKKEK